MIQLIDTQSFIVKFFAEYLSQLRTAAVCDIAESYFSIKSRGI